MTLGLGDVGPAKFVQNVDDPSLSLNQFIILSRRLSVK